MQSTERRRTGAGWQQRMQSSLGQQHDGLAAHCSGSFRPGARNRRVLCRGGHAAFTSVLWLCALGTLSSGTAQDADHDGHGSIESLHEDVASLWVTTSSSHACETNLNGITASSSRGSVPNAEVCRRMCERQGNCLAVDYYKNTQYCIFYSQVCVAPLADADGASSYHMMRETEWAVLSKSKACEGNSEGIRPFHMVDNRLSVQDCQQECTRRASCVAVDFYEVSGFCNLYNVSCLSPTASHNGASSYKVVAHMKARTVQEMKSPRLVPPQMRQWSHLHPSKACDINEEGVTPLFTPKEGGTTIEECHQSCEYSNLCIAVDHFEENGVCIPYSRPCIEPLDTEWQPSSWVLSSGPVHWEVLSSDHACETNQEGIRSLAPGEGAADLAHCQRKCELHADCMAVDFYQRTNWCILFGEACSNPHSDADGASAYRIIRTGLPHTARGASSASKGQGVLHMLRHRYSPSSDTPEEEAGEQAASVVIFIACLIATAAAACWLICTCRLAHAGSKSA